jgi:hypothetical protein
LYVLIASIRRDTCWTGPRASFSRELQSCLLNPRFHLPRIVSGRIAACVHSRSVAYPAPSHPEGNMFDGFERFQVQTSDPDVQIVGRIGGKGPPLLLLHGNPLAHVTDEAPEETYAALRGFFKA